jgi:hypothetical protein
MSDLFHYREHATELDRTRTYRQGSRRTGQFAKPEGLWVSVHGEDDWPAWCSAEEFALHELTVAHRVTLTDNANILTLETPEALGDFTAEYLNRDDPRDYMHAIDWQRVADRHDGIIIAPYQWTRRWDLNWYYGWDCASGCIWNLGAIAEFSATRFEVVR